MLKKKKEEKVIKEEVIDKKTKSKKVSKKEAKEKNRFGKEFKAEIKKIVWPSRKELFANSVVVIGSVLIVSVIIFLLDLGFNELTNLEIKAISGNKENTTVENVVDTTDANSVEVTGDTTNTTVVEGTTDAGADAQSFEVQE